MRHRIEIVVDADSDESVRDAAQHCVNSLASIGTVDRATVGTWEKGRKNTQESITPVAARSE